MACDQLPGGGALGEIAHGPGLHGPHHELLLGVHGQDQDGELGIVDLELAEDLQAVHARHGDVDHRHVRGFLYGQLNGFPAIGGFGHHLHVAAVFHDMPQAGPDNVVIVRQEHLDHWPSFSVWSRGTLK